MNLRDNLRVMLAVDEGYKPEVYLDSRGIKTWGTGHALPSLTEDEIAYILTNVGNSPKDIDNVLLDARINSIILDLQIRWTPYNILDDVRKAILIDMAYNMGIPGLMEFTNTLAMIQSGDYNGASVNMLKSLWATQVGVRATRLAWMMGTGKYHQDYISSGAMP